MAVMKDPYHYQEPVEDSNIDYMQDLDDDEAEETLSLCDLPTYCDAADWANDRCYSKEDQSSSSDDQEREDFFEFSSSEDFSLRSVPAENIIFCGKLITCKDPLSGETRDPPSEKEQPKPSKKRSSLFFQWKSSGWFSKPKASKYKSKKVDRDELRCNEYTKLNQVSRSKSVPASGNFGLNTGKCTGKYDISVQQVSFTRSPTKSRWHLLMFGITTVPNTEMDLRKMRSRQSRHHSSRTPSFRSFDYGEEVRIGKSSGKGLWGLLKALSCRAFHANDVVKATFGSISETR
ncbi:uncharacterized protein LOC131166515 [Malania oleifera]|uniref:uncharacterized protein LOC131166515 n=1 Tax=Malania oleifera TaxID=397392 RepID=UPI0025AE96B7|nr:uncharacterized protein LOC131166515 [Malania oleifera]